MIPQTLRISGFLSYFDPVEIDFTSFELACISGSNGAGKSSLLDAITWVLFGQARRRDDALINSHAPAAEVSLDFLYENNLYRVQRSKPRDKTGLLEFFLAAPDGSWKPLTEKSIRETEARIQHTLRLDYETFTNASFFLQGKADQFAQQRPGDRKRILSSILGLEVWEGYREQAANRRKGIESEMIGVDSLLAEIDSELRQEADRRIRLQQLEENLAQLQQLRQSQEASLENLRRLSASLVQQRDLVNLLQGQQQAALDRQQQRAAQLAARERECAVYHQQIDGEAAVRAEYAAWQAARLELERWDGVAANFRAHESKRTAPLTAIETERARLEQERAQWLEQERAAQQAQNSLPELEEQLRDAQAAVAQQQASLDRRAALEEELRGLLETQSELSAENRRLKAVMDELKERIESLRAVDGAACPLCGQALLPDDREAMIAGLESSGKEMGDQYRQNQTIMQQGEQRRAALNAELGTLRQAEAELRAQQRRADQLETRRALQLTTVNEWRDSGAPHLQALTTLLTEENFAAQARRDLALIDAALKDLGYDAAAHDAVRRSELAGRESEEKLRGLETARAALTPLEREIAALKEQMTAGELECAAQGEAYQQALARYELEAASVPDLKQVEREFYALKEQENGLQRQVGGARQAVEVLGDLRRRHSELTSRRTELARQVSQLKVLERSFSKDGVPALLIEQALPEIEAHTNDILDRLSSGAMSVRFATQKDYKDKNREDKKETLDILISDSAGWREYEMFSGGEAFRVNFAIRLALSRVLAQRAGARLQTLVIDEGFGSQDAEGRQRLIEAINMVQGDFAKILVITHLEELKEAFPARIEVEKTPRGTRVRVLV